MHIFFESNFWYVIFVVFGIFWYIIIPTAALAAFVGYRVRSCVAVLYLVGLAVGCYLGMLLGATMNYPGDSGMSYIMMGVNYYVSIFVLVPYGLGWLAWSLLRKKQ